MNNLIWFIITAIIVVLIGGAFITVTLRSLEFAIVVMSLCFIFLAVSLYAYYSRES